MSPRPSVQPADLVLSPTPLSGSARRWLARNSPEGVRFLELSTLRRQNSISLIQSLRTQMAGLLTVTGEEAELRLYRDMLLVVAILAKAERRQLLTPDGTRSPIRRRQLFPALARIAAGMALGQTRLLSTRAFLFSVARRAKPLETAVLKGERKCLYLKPLLMLGVATGGSVGHVAGVANALSRRGCRVRLLASHQQPMLDSSIVESQVAPSSFVALPAELNQLLYQTNFQSKAMEELSRFDPDFLYLRYSLNDLTARRLRSRFAVPLVVEFNGSEVWVQKNWGRALRFPKTAEAIERTVLQSADLVVVVSEAVKKQALSLGVPEQRVLFYPNCVDPTLFDPSRFDDQSRSETRRGLGVPADADLFSFVGTFGRWHGTPVLAAAIRHLAEREPDWLRQNKVHFLFVGDGAEGERVRSLLGPGLGHPFVTLAGLQPQHRTPAILAASDILVSPHVPNPDGTPFFGSPTKLFEYMAMERPILASDLDQIGQILRGWSPGCPAPASTQVADCAILLKPGSVQDLIAGLRRAVLMGGSEREAMGKRARSHVLRSFTWERNVEVVLAALQRLCPLR